jgi:hypothetical protein
MKMVGVSTSSGARWMIFQPKQLLWMLFFGFVVSGYDFSRAIKELKRIGLQPLPALTGQSEKTRG